MFKQKCSQFTLPQHKVEYPKNLDIQRTEIKETSDEKTLPKVHGKEKTTFEPIEVTLTSHEVEKIPGIKEDIVKDGKLDVSCLEKQIMKSTTRKESSKTYTDGTHEVIINFSREKEY